MQARPLPPHEASRQAAEVLGLTSAQLAQLLPPSMRTSRHSLANGITPPQQLKTPAQLAPASRSSSSGSLLALLPANTPLGADAAPSPDRLRLSGVRSPPSDAAKQTVLKPFRDISRAYVSFWHHMGPMAPAPNAQICKVLLVQKGPSVHAFCHIVR